MPRPGDPKRPPLTQEQRTAQEAARVAFGRELELQRAAGTLYPFKR